MKPIFNKMSKFPKRHLLIFLFSIYWDIIAWVIVLFLFLLGGRRLEWVNGLWVIVKSDSILKKTIFKSTAGGCLGHGGWIDETYAGKIGLDSKVELHEHVHTEQYEVIMFFTGIVNIIFAITLFGHDTLNYKLVLLLIQIFGGVMGLVSSTLLAILRGESYYRGSSHEESAYAREDKLK